MCSISIKSCIFSTYVIFLSDITDIKSFTVIAKKLGLSGFAVTGDRIDSISTITNDIPIYSRMNLTGKSINSVRKSLEKTRKKTIIVSVPLKSIEVVNWAVEDSRVDLLTVDMNKEHRLRDTTAHLAATSNTNLEIQIAPLLRSSGLNRSKILKLYRECVTTAIDAGMNVILSSGATHPMELRSEIAMVHIGILLGMNREYAMKAVRELPKSIIEENLKKLQPNFISSGVEVIKQGEDR